MEKFRVVYETIDGQTKAVTVEARDADDAEVKVYYNYPDCLQVKGASR
jgi:hypothetical protein